MDEQPIAQERVRASQCLFHCPWCGEALPPSQRDRWFDEIEALGLDPLADPLPPAYLDGAWRGAGDPADRGPERGGPIEGRIIDLLGGGGEAAGPDPSEGAAVA